MGFHGGPRAKPINTTGTNDRLAALSYAPFFSNFLLQFSFRQRIIIVALNTSEEMNRRRRDAQKRMGKEKRHILLCGSRRSGRSAMIRALTQDLTVPLYGYVTHTLRTNADGFHEIYLFPYGAADPRPEEACHVGDCDTRRRVIYDRVFDTLGVELLAERENGILVMDEIGFMESNAEAFCRTVLARLNGDGHVLAAVRTSLETPFLRQVLACEKAQVVEMVPERFEEIRRELEPQVKSWAEEGPVCRSI